MANKSGVVIRIDDENNVIPFVPSISIQPIEEKISAENIDNPL